MGLLTANDLLPAYGLWGDGESLSTDPLGTKDAAAADLAQRQEALQEQSDIADAARERLAENTNRALGQIDQYSDLGADALGTGQEGALAELYAGQAAAGSAVGQGADSSLGALSSGFGQGRGDLSAGYGAAEGSIASGFGAGAGALTAGTNEGRGDIRGALWKYDVTSAQDRLGGMLDKPGGLYAGFEDDPGYKFRLAEGEKAIMRNAAAQGGRGGGRTMKALQAHGQGLASQEFDKFASRRQAEAGIAGSSDAQRGGLLTTQAGRTDAAGRSLSDLAATRGQGLSSLYSGQGQALAGMQAARGQGLSGLSTGLADRQSGVYQAEGQSLANQAMAGSGARANVNQQTGQSLSDLYSSTGQQMGQTTLASGALDTSLTQQEMEGWSDFASGQSPEEAESENRMNVGSILASVFSDIRLKTDLEIVHGSKYEAIGLKGYRWKWNETAKRIFGLRGSGEGVIAQEVETIHPHAIEDMGHGYKGVNYAELKRLIALAAPVLPLALDDEPLEKVPAEPGPNRAARRASRANARKRTRRRLGAR